MHQGAASLTAVVLVIHDAEGPPTLALSFRATTRRRALLNGTAVVRILGFLFLVPRVERGDSPYVHDGLSQGMDACLRAYVGLYNYLTLIHLGDFQLVRCYVLRWT